MRVEEHMIEADQAGISWREETVSDPIPRLLAESGQCEPLYGHPPAG